MNQKKVDKGPSREWLLKMADAEDSCQSIAACGMAADLGMLRPVLAEPQRVFRKLIEFARRSKQMTVEQLADKADVDLAEIVSIEQDEYAVPLPRTVYQLAKTFNLSAGALFEIAGLSEPRTKVEKAALRFAARSESTAMLTDTERDALEEFVKVLVELSD